MKKIFRKDKINNEITINKIRLTGEGFNGSIVTLNEALQTAINLNLDLVLMSEANEIGICKIMNYEKFIYELGKKPKNKILDVKEIKLGANTAENDLEYRAKHIIEFLKKGHKVKISLQFRGREMAHIDLGKALILKLIVAVEEYGSPEAMPSMEGKKMYAYLKPKQSK